MPAGRAIARAVTTARGSSGATGSSRTRRHRPTAPIATRAPARRARSARRPSITPFPARVTARAVTRPSAPRRRTGPAAASATARRPPPASTATWASGPSGPPERRPSITPMAASATASAVTCPKSTTQTDWSGGSVLPQPGSAYLHQLSRRGPAGGTRRVRPPSITRSPEWATARAVTCPSAPARRTGGAARSPTVPAPETCIDCHLPQRPATVTSSGFDHALGGTGDCAACHQNPGVTWAGAIGGYDHSTMPAGTRCDSCHEAERPSAAVSVAWPGHPANPNQFLHSLLATTDCKSCHLDPGGAWSPGVYSHSPNPGQCSVCHLNQRPGGTVRLAGLRPRAGRLGRLRGLSRRQEPDEDGLDGRHLHAHQRDQGVRNLPRIPAAGGHAPHDAGRRRLRQLSRDQERDARPTGRAAPSATRRSRRPAPVVTRRTSRRRPSAAPASPPTARPTRTTTCTAW